MSSRQFAIVESAKYRVLSVLQGETVAKIEEGRRIRAVVIDWVLPAIGTEVAWLRYAEKWGVENTTAEHSSLSMSKVSEPSGPPWIDSYSTESDSGTKRNYEGRSLGGKTTVQSR